MVKTPSQMRNMVEDWWKITTNPYQDTTEKVQKKNPNIEWQFLFGQYMHVTKMKKRDDRIFIHAGLGFTKKAIDGFAKLEEHEKAETINGINELVVLSGLTCNWILKDKIIIGIEIRSHVDEEELNRPTLFRALDNVSSVGKLVVNKVTIKANPTEVQATDVSETFDKQMYT